MVESIESIKKDYTREEYIYLAKLYEKAEMYPNMIKSINKMILLKPKLNNNVKYYQQDLKI